MIGPTTWVQLTIVDSRTTSAVLFPRLRCCTGQGALEGFFRASKRPLGTKIERNTAREPKITFEPPRAPEPGSSPPALPMGRMGVGATAHPVSTPTDGRKYYNTGGL
jgi:hypothetical protein